MIRQLVSLRVVKEVNPIPNADAIELIKVRAWNVVAKKGEFKPGDVCVYFEIDSFLPADDSRFEFLKKSGVKKGADDKERIRLKTIKLRGQISQGLALPIEQFDELRGLPLAIDVSDRLDVIKYERPEPKDTNAAGIRPDFIPKTDEERIQNLWDKLSETEQDTLYVPTLKLDGSSCTVAFIGRDMEDQWVMNHEDIDEEKKAIEVRHAGTGEKFGEIIVCSRNMQLKYNPDSHFWKAVENARLPDILGDIGEDLRYSIAVQGEVCGPGIQGNKDKFPNFKFFAFNVFNITTQSYYDYTSVMGIFEEYGIESVPSLQHAFKVFKKFSTIEEILAYADGPSINAKYREGIVFKPFVNSSKDSFKVISNKFLLKGGDD